MTLVLINGFDDQMHGANVNGTWNTAFNTSVARTGSASMTSAQSNFGGTNMGLLALPGGGDATVILGCAMRFTATTVTLGWQFLSDNGATIHVTVTFAPATGVLTVYRGTTAGTVLGTVTLSGIPLLASTWVFWEVKVTLSDTVGEVHVRWNGNAAIDLTGQDTKNAGTKTVIDSIAYPAGTTGVTTYLDDLYIVTGTGAPSDFLGDCAVNTVYPDGNGAASQLLGSDGDSTNNYALVNEAGAPVTSSYVESDTTGQRDFYTMGDISIAANATVLAVQVTAYANNPDAGTGRSAVLGVRQGSSETLSTNQPLTANTFLPTRGMFTVDPATGAAWTQSGVNSAQAGLQVG